MKTVKLYEGQRVRIAGDSWIHKLTFHIGNWCKGYYIENDNVERFNTVNNTSFGICAFVTNPGCSITANYPGKDAEIARDKAEYESAVLIENGDIVEVEGIEYTFIATVIGVRYSDPVHLKIQPKKISETDKLKSIMEIVDDIAGIPAYAYGDNECACKMMDAIKKIGGIILMEGNK